MPSLHYLPKPLPDGKQWTWQPREAAYVRIYHKDFFTPSATHRRAYGPLARFDHHTPPFTSPDTCPDGRSITYVAETIRAAASEVFGDADPFGVCPQWRLAWLKTTASVVVQDIVGPAAMALKTRPALGSSPEVTREFSQQCARDIYAGHPHVAGIRYTGSHEEGRCLALWERAPDLKIVEDATTPCDYKIVDDEMWAEILMAYASTTYTLERINVSECDYCREAAEAEGTSVARK